MRVVNVVSALLFLGLGGFCLYQTYMTTKEGWALPMFFFVMAFACFYQVDDILKRKGP